MALGQDYVVVAAELSTGAFAAGGATWAEGSMLSHVKSHSSG
jgi:hypothetical protein